MTWLKAFTFGELFGLTVVVGGSAHAVFATLGLLLAVFDPGVFHYRQGMAMVSAQSFLQAFGILVGLVVALMLANLMVAALGASVLAGAKLLLGARRSMI